MFGVFTTAKNAPKRWEKKLFVAKKYRISENMQ